MVVVFVYIDGIVDLTATLILTEVIMHSLVYFLSNIYLIILEILN
jgi:hypothetical protein